MNQVWAARLLRVFLSLLPLLLSLPTFAQLDKIIYGDDNRQTVADFGDAKWKELARSTAGMVDAKSISVINHGLSAEIKSTTLKVSMKLCDGERFADLPTAPSCSGFLVGEDLLVTAAHCVTGPESCKSNKWVFDYRADAITQEGDKVLVNAANIYSCKEIISRRFTRQTKNDYAMIRLDRKVKGRKPLAVRTSGKVEDSATLIVIGHPSGLPLIVSDDGHLRDNRPYYYFLTNLDTFGGNSGSLLDDTFMTIQGQRRSALA
ncbi:MAG: serine protease [Pseudomonadota bacterium]